MNRRKIIGTLLLLSNNTIYCFIFYKSLHSANMGTEIKSPVVEFAKFSVKYLNKTGLGKLCIASNFSFSELFYIVMELHHNEGLLWDKYNVNHGHNFGSRHLLKFLFKNHFCIYI